MSIVRYMPVATSAGLRHCFRQIVSTRIPIRMEQRLHAASGVDRVPSTPFHPKVSLWLCSLSAPIETWTLMPRESTHCFRRSAGQLPKHPVEAGSARHSPISTSSRWLLFSTPMAPAYHEVREYAASARAAGSRCGRARPQARHHELQRRSKQRRPAFNDDLGPCNKVATQRPWRKHQPGQAAELDSGK